MKKVIFLALLCAFLTGCSNNNTSVTATSSESTSGSSSDSSEVSATEEVIFDDIELNSAENEFFPVFMCGDWFIGTDEWTYLNNGYSPEMTMNDGEFIEVNADVTYMNGGEAGFMNVPQIDKLISETPVDAETAIEKYSIPPITDSDTFHTNLHYYRNAYGTYIIAPYQSTIRVYLNGEFVGEADNSNSDVYKRLMNIPELLNVIANGDSVPVDGSGCAILLNSGSAMKIDADTLLQTISDGIINTDGFFDLSAVPFTEEFEKKCRENGIFAEFIASEGMEIELYGNIIDADYIIVASETPDGHAYISFNGEDMKEFPAEYVSSILDAAQK